MQTMTTLSTALPDDAPHLLVVDDDRRIRDLLSRFLFAEGYRVTTADTAADARAKLQGLRFDLLILDVMMPIEDGFSLAESVRKISKVPIVLLTARGMPEDRIRGLSIGADDYVPKPFEPATFTPGEVVRGFVGVDGGSTSTKAVLLSTGGDVLCKVYQLSKGNPIQDTIDMFDGLRAQGATPLPRGPLTRTQMNRLLEGERK